MKKTTNSGNVDAYRQRQNQLGSSAFEQTDYSAFEPMSKKTFNTNDMLKQRDNNSPRKAVTDINYEKEKNKKPHNVTTAKQSMLTSAFDQPRTYVAPAKVEE
jgi:hypothetical protein